MQIGLECGRVRCGILEARLVHLEIVLDGFGLLLRSLSILESDLRQL